VPRNRKIPIVTYEAITKMNNRQLAQLLENAYKMKKAGGPKAAQAAQVMAWIAQWVAQRDGFFSKEQIARITAGINAGVK
jgi:hypothetical protein